MEITKEDKIKIIKDKIDWKEGKVSAETIAKFIYDLYEKIEQLENILKYK